MRLGQTSFVVFVTELVSSVLGFAATLYISRTLGAEVLGYYALALIVANWLSLLGNVGLGGAITKRLSEGDDPDSYFTAGALSLVALSVLCGLVIFVFRSPINAYIGVDAAWFVLLLIGSLLFNGLVTWSLQGDKQVHIAGFLSTVKIGLRSVVQIALVFAGFGLVGMLVGFATGAVVAGLLGLVFLSVRLRRPRAEHFERLFDFAKFSWLGNLSGRVFNQVDILVLGVFVSPVLVGVYSVAWSLTSFVGTFGSSIRQSTFPELSNASADERTEAIASMISESLAYIGLFAIPGFFGCIVLADRLLTLYGDEFTQGATVLALLVLSMTLWDYTNQLLTSLNAIDRPDRSFRVNAVFIAVNLALNVALVVSLGWVGAAIATLVAALVGLVLSYYYLSAVVRFEVPLGEISRQVAAAAVMAVVVYGLRRGIESMGLLNHNAAIVAILVAVGGATYFALLMTISARFRKTLVNNSPVRIPFLS
ncbi:flippase [Salinigranum halophilum]|uniref:flippase n=1 Tax=Salinigranum halophilum TaxID=2565931 RepID=UPI0010A8F7A7|nr:flippase [Salinigranum halophilum]